jgi:hypothetical protein
VRERSRERDTERGFVCVLFVSERRVKAGERERERREGKGETGKRQKWWEPI